jgi:hypothetical protein
VLLLVARGGAPRTTVGIVAPPPETLSVTLTHRPTGTFDLSWDPKRQQVTADIRMTGLAPESSHAAHIQARTCAVDGVMVYSLHTLRGLPQIR